jgi:cytochrome c55X
VRQLPYGPELEGGFGPSLLPQVLADKPIGEIARTIFAGKPGTRMHGWASTLTIGEVSWLASALREGLPEANDGPVPDTPSE